MEIKLPNIWKEGALFAFSGWEGETDWYHPFVATSLPSPGSLLFHTQPKRKLLFKGKQIKNSAEDIVTSDFLSFSRPFLTLVFLNNNTLVGECDSTLIPEVSSDEGIKEMRTGNTVFQSAPNAYSVLIWEKDAGKTKFSYAFHPNDIQESLAKAKEGLKVNLLSERDKKLNFFKRLPRPKFPDPILERTYYKACSVLKVNIESLQGKIQSIWTTPDRFPHRDMWFWDSAFHSFGNRYISLKLAEDTLRAVLQLQKEDGFIAHQMNPEHGKVTKITQPPLFIWASYELYCESRNEEFLAYVYPKIKKYIFWLYKNRDKDRDGLLEWEISPYPICKCGESGMDNSPRFDRVKPGEAMAAIDLNCFAINEMEYLLKIANILGEKSDADFWEKERKEKIEVVNARLWDDKDHFYYDLRENGEFNKIKTVSSFLPLFAGIPDKNQAESLLKHLKNRKEFRSDFPIPSVSLDEPLYCKDMWRGPTWINYNFLIIRGLKRYGYNELSHNIAYKTLQEIAKWYQEKGVIFEYYDAESEISPDKLPRKEWLGDKKGVGVIKDYHWSAAIYVTLAHSCFTSLDNDAKN